MEKGTTGSNPPTPNGFGADPRAFGRELLDIDLHGCDPDDPAGLDDRHLGTVDELGQRTPGNPFRDEGPENARRAAAAFDRLADAVRRLGLAARRDNELDDALRRFAEAAQQFADRVDERAERRP